MRRLLALLLAAAASLPAQNDPERIEWFRDLGFGLFIHWSLDSQVGSVISHSMVGADEAYLDRFEKELPRTFYPYKFDAREWARLAKIAGFRYVVFTAKHHSGFCMFHTKTTDFSIEHTPFERDITREIIEAFRAQGHRDRPLFLAGRLPLPPSAGDAHQPPPPRGADQQQPGPARL